MFPLFFQKGKQTKKVYIILEKQERETTTMAFKTISENAKAFTFTYTFEDFYTAKIAANALIGYMYGVYEEPTYKAEITDKGRLELKYREDSDLNEFFNRICGVAVKCCTG